MKKVLTTKKRKGSEAMVETTLPLLYESFCGLPMGFGGRIWRKRGAGFSGLESYSREEERENRSREKTRENGRGREFLGFFFMNFQEEEGYLYKKLGEKRDSRGLLQGGCAATPWGPATPPNLILIYSHFCFSMFCYCLDVYESFDFFKIGTPGKAWMSSFHSLQHHPI